MPISCCKSKKSTFSFRKNYIVSLFLNFEVLKMNGKKFNVYGIGNALVDLVTEVTPEFLEKYQVEKGVMTLVSQQRQEELLAAIEQQEYTRACGGSAANTLIAIAQLGGKAYYSCKVASDEWGDFYKDDLEKNGVQNNLDLQREAGITGKCMVMVTPDADRTMNTFLGITEQFSCNELVEEYLVDAEFLYIEGYLVASTSAKEAAIKAHEIARQNGVKSALTFSDPNMVNLFRDGLLEMIGPGVDLLFCNELEAKTFAQCDDLSMAIQRCHDVAKIVAITLGDRGAVISDGDNQFDIAAKKVKAIDTNGAGDIFAGTFLYAITHGMNLREAGDFSCRVAGELVQFFGPRLKHQQIQQLKIDFNS